MVRIIYWSNHDLPQQTYQTNDRFSWIFPSNCDCFLTAMFPGSTHPVGHTDQVKEVISQSNNIHMCIYIYTIYTYIKTCIYIYIIIVYVYMSWPWNRLWNRKVRGFILITMIPLSPQAHRPGIDRMATLAGPGEGKHAHGFQIPIKPRVSLHCSVMFCIFPQLAGEGL